MSFNCGPWYTLMRFLDTQCGVAFFGKPKFTKVVECPGIQIGDVLVTEQMAQALHDLCDQGGGLEPEPESEPEPEYRRSRSKK